MLVRMKHLNHRTRPRKAPEDEVSNRKKFDGVFEYATASVEPVATARLYISRIIDTSQSLRRAVASNWYTAFMLVKTMPKPEKCQTCHLARIIFLRSEPRTLMR